MKVPKPNRDKFTRRELRRMDRGMRKASRMARRDARRERAGRKKEGTK